MEKCVVLSDLHGQAELFDRAVDHYDNDVNYVVNGDIFDGHDQSRRLMDRIIEVGAALNRANHCWATLGAITDIDQGRREGWQEVWLKRSPSLLPYEYNTLKSYGLTRYPKHEDTAKAFKYRLQELGHLAVLERATLYTETDEFLAIHAGLDESRTWPSQQRELDAIAAKAQAHIFDQEPAYLFSQKYANDPSLPPGLNKALVTGHSHLQTTDQRTFGNPEKPNRIMLASKLAIGAPLYVYESWTGQIRAFPQD